MTAVYRHELRMYFKGMGAYLFSALILLFAGIYTMRYNLNIGVSNYEYAIQDTTLAFVIGIPLMTMRSIVQEKVNKTDQLLYSLPLKMRDIVLGKYLALITVLAVPVGIMGIYPLVLSMYGSVYLPQAYSALAGFFFLGCALIAIGMFVSSVTESQIASGGISFVVLLLLYMLNSFSEYLPSSARVSYYICVALTLVIMFILDRMLHNDAVVITVFAVMTIGLTLTYYLNAQVFEGLFTNMASYISIFDQFDVFANGLFDMTCVVYMLSIAGVFLFLTVQAMEKRRWS